MALEQELVELDQDDDKVLIEQMRGYRVKTWSSHGMPASYETDAESGDHDHDAWVLAMLGIEIEYGLYHTQESVRRLAQVMHVAGWGAGPTGRAHVNSEVPTSPGERVENMRQGMRDRTGTPSRLQQLLSAKIPKIVHSGQGMAYVSPGSATVPSSTKAPSRTDCFRARVSSVGGRPNVSPFHTIGAGLVFNR